jgi:hypothetical protein
MPFSNLIGGSLRFQVLLDEINLTAPVDCAVLLRGETGLQHNSRILAPYTRKKESMPSRSKGNGSTEADAISTPAAMKQVRVAVRRRL